MRARLALSAEAAGTVLRPSAGRLGGKMATSRAKAIAEASVAMSPSGNPEYLSPILIAAFGAFMRIECAVASGQ